MSDHAAGLRLKTRCDDLHGFQRHLAAGERADLILCMGDTLTHLESMEFVVALGRAVAGRLAPGGRFVATFRDYSRLPAGAARFIPWADEDRILTCFLEEFEGYVQVHDILHERASGTWAMRAGSYRKLRLAAEVAREAFAGAGLRTTVEAGPRGMLRLVADGDAGRR
ncbi:MAG: hypothetical protein AB7Q97_22515 [Gammaproteobacteria bacterium]